jgi:PmbA protein
MNLQDFQQALLDTAAKKGFTAAEVYIAGGRSLEVRIFQEQISHYESSIQRGISFRGLFNGKMGYAFSEKIDPELIPWMLDQAAGNAAVLSESENEDLFPGEPWQPADCYSDKLARLEPASLISAARQLEKGAKEADPRIRAVEYAISEYVESERMIANTLGLAVQDKTNLALAYAVARAQSGDSLKKGVEFWQGRDFTSLDAAAVGAGAAGRAVNLLGAKTVKSGKMPVILDQRAAADLLKVFLPVFSLIKSSRAFHCLAQRLVSRLLHHVST